MKAGLFIAGLVSVAAAQPHRRHQHQHEKRQAVVVDVVTEIVTASAPDVVVYVDESGNPVSTSYVNAPEATVAPAPSSTDIPVIAAFASPAAAWTPPAALWKASSAAAVSVSVAQSSAVVVAPAPAPTTAAPVEAPSSAAPIEAPSSAAAPAPAQSSSAAPVSSSNSGVGITYSPYNADGTCKSASQVNADFNNLGGYSMIRLYGVDCNQLNTVGSAAIAKGMKIFAGVYDITQVNSAIAQIIAFANGNWQHIDTVSVGNELINSGQASVASVVAAVNTARSLLRAAGYNGPVVTVDTWNAMIANPALCQASDYAAVNAHAFFTPTVTAANAGSYVVGCAQSVSQACGGMNTVITESGWPSQGSANGAAVPGQANQATAIASLKSSFSSNLIVFNAYNDLWKKNNAGTFGAEQYWGVYGSSTA